jgi:mannitol-specific phosphotransferase system IIBC component
MNVSDTFGTRIGTLGGTILTVVINISTGDVIRTMILATIGAVVSFTISILLKRIIKWLNGKPPDLIE